GSLRDLVLNFDRWRARREAIAHTELAEIVLDESGYTEMWQKDRSADAAGRLENLKELVRSMEEFENLQGFLEHIALVMDRDRGGRRDHGIKGRLGLGRNWRLRSLALRQCGILRLELHDAGLAARPGQPRARQQGAGPRRFRRGSVVLFGARHVRRRLRTQEA